MPNPWTGKGSPDDAAYINARTDAVGFVGASSLERLAVEQPLPELTRQFKRIPVPAAARFLAGEQA